MWEKEKLFEENNMKNVQIYKSQHFAPIRSFFAVISHHYFCLFFFDWVDFLQLELETLSPLPHPDPCKPELRQLCPETGWLYDEHQLKAAWPRESEACCSGSCRIVGISGIIYNETPLKVCDCVNNFRKTKRHEFSLLPLHHGPINGFYQLLITLEFVSNFPSLQTWALTYCERKLITS